MLHRDRIQKAQQEASPEKETARLASIYKVLGDPTRLKMVMGLDHVREGRE